MAYVTPELRLVGGAHTVVLGVTEKIRSSVEYFHDVDRGTYSEDVELSW